MTTSTFLLRAALGATVAIPWSAAIAQRPLPATRRFLPRYSAEPAPANESAQLGVFKQLLRSVTMRDRSIALNPDSEGSLLVPSVAAVRERIPSDWPDSLRREVEDALSDPAFGSAATPGQVEPAAQQLGIPMVPFSRNLTTNAAGSPEVLYLSQPGFNHDSTIAAVRVTSDCGALCGSGTTWLLSRRPGYRWLVWFQWVFWVS